MINVQEIIDKRFSVDEDFKKPNRRNEMNSEGLTAEEAFAQLEMAETVETEENVEAVEKKYHDEQTEETINFKLNEAELASVALNLRGIEDKINEKKEELKSETKKLKDELKDLDAVRVSYLRQIEEGEDRLVPCVKRVFPDKVQFISLDGSVVFKERGLEDKDKQLRLVTDVSDSMVEHSKDIDYDENHRKARDAEELSLVDESEELEPITDKTLRDNTPSF